ncbi:MAG: BON domain-containing protein [Arenimonas sp.]
MSQTTRRHATLILAALVALATGACQTMSSNDADDTPDPNANTSATVNPAIQNPADPNASLHDRVHDALMEAMGPKVNDLGITMHGTMAHLTGHVHSAADKQQAHDIAHGVSGVTAVDISALSVQP